MWRLFAAFFIGGIMNLIDLREDLKKGSKGTPIYIGEMTFWLKRWGTKDSNKAIEKIKQELYGLFPDPKEMDENEVWAHWLISYALVDWENIRDFDNNVLPFSSRSVLWVFQNIEFWGHGGLVNQLVNQAIEINNFLHDAIDEDTEAVKK